MVAGCPPKRMRIPGPGLNPYPKPEPAAARGSGFQRVAVKWRKKNIPATT